MASDLIALQAKALQLQDTERSLEGQLASLQEELAKEFRLTEKDPTNGALKPQALKYLDTLCTVVKSRKIASAVTPVVGEIRIRLSTQESVVLEVGPSTEFGDIVETVLDYIGYPKSINDNSSHKSNGQKTVKKSDTRLGITTIFRSRNDFCLCDEFGALFCNETKVAETFASSAILWMASLTIKPNGKTEFFDPEEEIASFFSAPENAQWITNMTEKDRGVLDRAYLVEALANAEADHKLSTLRTYDQVAAVSAAHDLLVAVNEQYFQELATADLTVIGKHSKLKKRQAIELANERRNQSRRQGLLLECFIQLIFVLFAFFAAFAYSDYVAKDSEFVTRVYNEAFAWNTTNYPTLESYFEGVIMPWPAIRANGTWQPQEVRLRQLRVSCTSLTQCERYSEATKSVTSPFNSTAFSSSANPDAFVYQQRSPSLPILPLSWYWDSRALITDYDDDGGYFIFWPPSNTTTDITTPDFSGWVDAGTAFVSIEFNVYDANTNTIVAMKVIAQYPNYRMGALHPGSSDVFCGTNRTLQPLIVPVVLIFTSNDLDTLIRNQTTMTVLCAFALLFGVASISRGLGIFKLAVSGDRDIARAVEVYRPNAGLLRAAMTALRVARSERLFNPSVASLYFWLFVDVVNVCLIIAALVYHYVVVSPSFYQFEIFSFGVPTAYQEFYQVGQDIRVVLMLLSFSSWIAIFGSMRLLVLISSGVLIADTVTRAILPGLAVLFICGYIPIGIALASSGYVLFGYSNPDFSSLEISGYSVVSRVYRLDPLVTPSWPPVFKFITLMYFTVTNAVAYAIIFHAYQRESSKLVKGPFTIWEILWPFPALQAWMQDGFKNDLWSSASRKTHPTRDESDTKSGSTPEDNIRGLEPNHGGISVTPADFDGDSFMNNETLSESQYNIQEHQHQDSGPSDGWTSIYQTRRGGADIETPEELDEVAVRRGSIASVDNPADESTLRSQIYGNDERDGRPSSFTRDQ